MRAAAKREKMAKTEDRETGWEWTAKVNKKKYKNEEKITKNEYDEEKIIVQNEVAAVCAHNSIHITPH